MFQIQVYFLSIFFNLVAALLLSAKFFEEKIAGFSAVKDFLGGKTLRFIVGLATSAVGVVNLFVVMGGSPIILGDFFPAVIAIFMGFILLFEIYRARLTSSSLLGQWDKILVDNKAVWGFIGFIITLLHFFFAKALFL